MYVAKFAEKNLHPSRISKENSENEFEGYRDSKSPIQCNR